MACALAKTEVQTDIIAEAPKVRPSWRPRTPGGESMLGYYGVAAVWTAVAGRFALDELGNDAVYRQTLPFFGLVALVLLASLAQRLRFGFASSLCLGAILAPLPNTLSYLRAGPEEVRVVAQEFANYQRRQGSLALGALSVAFLLAAPFARGRPRLRLAVVAAQLVAFHLCPVHVYLLTGNSEPLLTAAIACVPYAIGVLGIEVCIHRHR